MISISELDIHPHLKARMSQRGITIAEIVRVINEGWEVSDAKPGTLGKVFVFQYNNIWEEKVFQEKEVCVYYKFMEDKIVLLTAKARYGKDFSKEGESNEAGI